MGNKIGQLSTRGTIRWGCQGGEPKWINEGSENWKHTSCVFNRACRFRYTSEDGFISM